MAKRRPPRRHQRAAAAGRRPTSRPHIDQIQGLEEAAQALALRLLLGAKCTGCGAVVTTNSLLIGIAENAHLADGSTWTAQEALEAGICYWRVTGERWTQGCEPIGERCPVCTHAAALILPGQGDAFCDNDKCRLLKWEMTQTFNDFMRDNFEGNIKEINLHNSGE